MMTSIANKYYRRIIQNIDNVRMKFDISSLLVKSKEHDSKIDTNESNISGNKSLIDTNESNISGNKSLIDTNTNNITNNLSKINDNNNNINNNLSKINTNNNNFTSVLNKSNNNVSSISSNLNKINTNLSKITNNTNKINNNTSLIDNNRNNISSNSSLINTYIKGLNLINTNTSNNSSDISNNLSLIDTNKNNITNNYNLTQINKKKSEFNTSLIDNNRNNISSNVTKINSVEDKVSSNNNLISNNFTSILPLKSNYTIDNIWLFNLNSNKDINFLSNIKKILVYETNIDYQFKVNSFIEINESILYKYENIKSFYFVLKETYVIMDQNDNILDKFSFNITSKGAVFRNYHIYNNQYFFKVQSDIKILKLKVYLERLNDDNNMEFNLQLNSDYQNNFIALKYFKYTS